MHTSYHATNKKVPEANICNLKSKIRQVPDNQEVFLDKDGFTSIVFDITERVGLPGSDEKIDGAAMTVHLEEIVDDDLDTVKVWSMTRTEFSEIP